MNLPKRKNTRLKGYDYSTPSSYFVTVCTHNRKCLLSGISVGSIHESTKCMNGLPENILTPHGECVEKFICQIENRYQNVRMDKYIIMPNHIHMLITIIDDNIGNNGERAIHESPQRKRNRSVLSNVVGYIKMNSSKQIHLTYKGEVWQRNYHDHIVRNEKDYNRIWEYIDTNVYRWDKDCFYENITTFP